jgi:predicted RNA-binding protein with PIN domain
MASDQIIVDGNNLLHAARKRRGSAGRDFDSSRWDLVREMDGLAGEIAGAVTVVFDGTVGGREEAFQTRSLEVIYSPASMDADTLIEGLVARAPDPARVVVVTSDRLERQMVEGRGAVCVSCERFLDDLDDAWSRLRGRLSKPPAGRPAGPRLGDFFPPGAS